MASNRSASGSSASRHSEAMPLLHADGNELGSDDDMLDATPSTPSTRFLSGNVQAVDTSSVAHSRSDAVAPTSQDSNAITIRDLWKGYTVRRKHNYVLEGLDMTVERGKVYGLLGPSGCGKTTLLKCIVGRLRPDAGTVRVLGKAPLTRHHSVPGADVGYMPQETALFDEFTVQEALVFFSRINHMKKEDALARIKFLLKLLDIEPQRLQRVATLSGGQKRRVSFAAALVHSPRLVLADEPTVGVDPLLRARLWAYLGRLTNPKHGDPATVIITTHYIDEARQADCVGMMRNGRLLAEAPPDQLLQRYNMTTLEDVFLNICRGVEAEALRLRHAQGSTEPVARHLEPEEDKLLDYSEPADDEAIPFGPDASAISDKAAPPEHIRHKFRGPGAARASILLALARKNILKLLRNIPVLLFQFLLPAIQVCLYCLAIGRDPEGLNMAVVNLDEGVGAETFCNQVHFMAPEMCQLQINHTYFSDQYLSYLSKRDIDQVPMESLDKAISHVRKGKAWGVYYFERNFTASLLARYSGSDTSPGTINASEVHVYLDNTNQEISIVIQEKSLEAFQEMAAAILKALKKPPQLAELPVHFEKPIYGSAQPSFINFVAPGILATIIFAQSIGLTAMAFVLDQKEGILDRIWAAGVRPTEVILGHISAQFFVLLVQTALMLACALGIFGLPIRGSIPLTCLLMLLLGLSGMSYGMFISTCVTKETEAMILALGSFFPVLILSGILWPLEAIPEGLNYISYVLPTTWSGEAMRSLMLRGWSMDHMNVWLGFVVVICWSTLFLFFSAIRIKSVD